MLLSSMLGANIQACVAFCSRIPCGNVININGNFDTQQRHRYDVLHKNTPSLKLTSQFDVSKVLCFAYLLGILCEQGASLLL